MGIKIGKQHERMLKGALSPSEPWLYTHTHIHARTQWMIDR